MTIVRYFNLKKLTEVLIFLTPQCHIASFIDKFSATRWFKDQKYLEKRKANIADADIYIHPSIGYNIKMLAAKTTSQASWKHWSKFPVPARCQGVMMFSFRTGTRPAPTATPSVAPHSFTFLNTGHPSHRSFTFFHPYLGRIIYIKITADLNYYEYETSLLIINRSDCRMHPLALFGMHGRTVVSRREPSPYHWLGVARWHQMGLLQRRCAIARGNRWILFLGGDPLTPPLRKGHGVVMVDCILL